MTHIKRKTIPEFWPISRTGTKYMAVPSHNIESSIPLIIVIRDILGLVKNMKEMKKIVHEKKVSVNGKIVSEINYPITLFDTFAIPSINKFYKTTLNERKIEVIETKGNETTKVDKVIGKKILPGKKIQLNFKSGRNIISNEKIATGDFAVIDLEKNKIKKIIKLEKDSKIIIIEGKHKGKAGKIKEIIKEGENIVAKIKSEEEEISTNIKNLFALE
jgi:small subunit ribosomal protein S4e